jgi:hypothetical protein
MNRLRAKPKWGMINDGSDLPFFDDLEDELWLEDPE